MLSKETILKRKSLDKMRKERMMYYTYMLRCEDNSIYTGITTDLERRMKEHFEKEEKCAKYTRRHTAKKLECAWQSENRILDSKLEYAIKHISKQEKENIIQTHDLSKINKIEPENYVLVNI